MVILMDTIAIAGGVHSVSLYEQAMSGENHAKTAHGRKKRQVCRECRDSVTLRNNEAKIA